jgi:hypothetical protein
MSALLWRSTRPVLLVRAAPLMTTSVLDVDQPPARSGAAQVVTPDALVFRSAVVPPVQAAKLPVLATVRVIVAFTTPPVERALAKVVPRPFGRLYMTGVTPTPAAVLAVES